ncbi:MAG: amino acid adenylation domain-containing protein [Clostridium sp.]|nr:amino acid adenylation domain-containing protein [Clostridium sp.]
MKHTVLCYLEKTVIEYGNRIAVEDGIKTVTFTELYHDAVRISHRISCRNPSQSSCPILVFLPKCTDAIIAFLAVLYSGNFYVPCDVRAPKERLRKIVDTLNPAAILTTKNLANRILDLGIDRERLLLLDTPTCDDNDHEEGDCNNSDCKDFGYGLAQIIDTDPVYAMFTSGSTGVPKGVLVSHRGVLDYIDWAKETYSIDTDTIIGNQAPLFFDNSTLDLYLCLACGARLVLLPERLFAFPAELLRFLEEHKVNFLFWVPSALAHIANMNALENTQWKPSKVLFAGEVMPAKQLNYWRKHVPNALYSNLYGPTEITVDCTYYILDRTFEDSEPIPIGKACRNTGILLLDEQNKEPKRGSLGEICVRGSGLALGYWNNPETTAAVFVQNPLNSHYPEKIYRTGDLAYYNDRDELIYAGRSDFQIKHMGYRIELGEIETMVFEVDGIDGTCVLYDYDTKEIVLFYTGDADKIALKKILYEKLPKYMVPSKLINLTEFPLNANGKIDRVALKEML